MSQLLSSSQIDLLLPALRHLAEMVRDHGSVERAALPLFVIASGLHGDEFEEELERWALILQGVTRDGTGLQQEVARRALAMRGMSDAPAALAVSIVAQGTRPRQPATQHPLHIEPSRLDFGVLEYGETKRLSLTVTGGPGRVELGSDRIAASTEVFGPEETEVRIGVDPSVEGVLYTNVRFVTHETTLEVPLIAQWLAQDSPWNQPRPERYVPIYLIIDALDSSPLLPKRVTSWFQAAVEDRLMDPALAWAAGVCGHEQAFLPCKDEWRPFCLPALSYGRPRRLDLALSTLRKALEAELTANGLNRGLRQQFTPHVIAILSGPPEDADAVPSANWKIECEKLQALPRGYRPHLTWLGTNDEVASSLREALETSDVLTLSDTCVRFPFLKYDSILEISRGPDPATPLDDPFVAIPLAPLEPVASDPPPFFTNRSWSSSDAATGQRTIPLWSTVAAPSQDRHLPVYLLIDTSQDMAGAPIAAIAQGIELFGQETVEDPFSRDAVRAGVITFGGTATLLTPGLVSPHDLRLPCLEARGHRCLDQAFAVLRQSIDQHVVRAVRGGRKGDWRPVVFLLISGPPEDANGLPSSGWQKSRELVLNPGAGRIAPLCVVGVGCGPEVDEVTLQAISTGTAIRMGTDQASFIALLQYITQSLE